MCGLYVMCACMGQGGDGGGGDIGVPGWEKRMKMWNKFYMAGGHGGKSEK